MHSASLFKALPSGLSFLSTEHVPWRRGAAADPRAVQLARPQFQRCACGSADGRRCRHGGRQALRCQVSHAHSPCQALQCQAACCPPVGCHHAVAAQLPCLALTLPAPPAGFPLRHGARNFPGFASVPAQGMNGSDYSCPGSVLQGQCAFRWGGWAPLACSVAACAAWRAPGPCQLTCFPCSCRAGGPVLHSGGSMPLLPAPCCRRRTSVEAAVMCMNTLQCRTIVVFRNGESCNLPAREGRSSSCSSGSMVTWRAGWEQPMQPHGSIGWSGMH